MVVQKHGDRESIALVRIIEKDADSKGIWHGIIIYFSSTNSTQQQ